jgi:RimJ/RimL family protein N-acetyltransferase
VALLSVSSIRVVCELFSDTAVCEFRVPPKVLIGRLRDGELREVLRWTSDPGFRGDFLPYSRLGEGRARARLRGLIESGSTKFLAVRNTGTRNLVGLLLYQKPYGFDYYEVGFYVIPAERGRGYAPEAMRLLVKFLLRRKVKLIVAGTSSLNVASQRALAKAGFEEGGRLRGTLLRLGAWEDSVVYTFYRKEAETAEPC